MAQSSEIRLILKEIQKTKPSLHKISHFLNVSSFALFRVSHASELLRHEKTFHFRCRVLLHDKTISGWCLPIGSGREVSLVWHRMHVRLLFSHRQLLPGLFRRLPQLAVLQRRKYNLLILCIIFFASFIPKWPFTLFAGKIQHVTRVLQSGQNACSRKMFKMFEIKIFQCLV